MESTPTFTLQPVEPGNQKNGKRRLRAAARQYLELQKVLAEKKEAYEAAASEHSRLTLRLRVLEAVLPIREQQVHLLQSQHPCACADPDQLDGPCADNPSPLLVITDCSSEQSASSSTVHVERPGVRSEPEGAEPSPRSSHSPCPHQQGGEELSGRVLDVKAALAEIASREELPPHQSLALRSLCGSAASACARTPEPFLRDYCARYGSWIATSALQLHAVDARPHEPGPQQRIAQHHDSLLSYFRHVRLAYPRLAADLLSLDMETCQPAPPPPESFWASVARGVRCTAEQAAECRAALMLYRERVGKVLAEREQLVQQLTQHLPQALEARPGEFTSSQRHLVAVEELVQRLARNVAREEHESATIKDFMGSGIFTRTQVARAGVLSYPYWPDAVAVLNAIAEVTDAQDTAAAAQDTAAAQPADKAA